MSLDCHCSLLCAIDEVTTHGSADLQIGCHAGVPARISPCGNFRGTDVVNGFTLKGAAIAKRCIVQEAGKNAKVFIGGFFGRGGGFGLRRG